MKLTTHQEEILRRMEPGRWYFPRNLQMPRGITDETIYALAEAGLLEIKRLFTSEDYEDETRRQEAQRTGHYCNIIRKPTTVTETTPYEVEDLKFLKKLVEKYGKDTVVTLVKSKAWENISYAWSSVPPLASKEPAGNLHEEIEKLKAKWTANVEKSQVVN